MVTKNRPKKTKRRKKRSPPKDILKYKARNLRSSMRSRARRSGTNPEEVPTPDELYKWLTNRKLVCYYTGEPVILGDMQIDHKKPRSRGGSDSTRNLCITSSGINRAKGNFTDKEFLELLTLADTWEPLAKETLLKRLKQAWRY